VVPLQVNRAYTTEAIQYHSPKHRLVLPFIDDFSYPGPYPDATLWQDSGAYINNTMSATPMTRGMATLDGLNAHGRPYFEQPFNSGYADSLTCRPLNLSTFVPADSVYLSFFYQPQGLGFAPENGDSLFLYFRNKTNQWIRMWQSKGTPLQAFKAVMIPLSDTQFLHASFQFRFVNLASMNTNDDVWNLDYIKLDASRNQADSTLNDVAFTLPPGNLLKNYQSMPYRHYLANQSNETAADLTMEVRNGYSIPYPVSIRLDAKEMYSSTPINTQSLPSTAVGAKSYLGFTLPVYSTTYTAPGLHSTVWFRNRYFFDPVNGSDKSNNDTIDQDQVFDNYFAYDDGTAEKSYFLLNAINFPAKTALQFTLNQSDTLRGLMVHFGAQLPSAAGKYFSMVLYKTLGTASSNDSVILQEDLYQVMYEAGYNGFTTYAFSTPPVLQAGTYYMGITQPANFGSDSIYYGLDVNTQGNAQHLYYNVDGTWNASTANGSIMMRPMVGQAFTPSILIEPTTMVSVIELYPNPVSSFLYIEPHGTSLKEAEVFSLTGQSEGRLLLQNTQVDVSHLPAGIHFIRFRTEDGNCITKKFYKL